VEIKRQAAEVMKNECRERLQEA